jgi:hypothetical protein
MAAGVVVKSKIYIGDSLMKNKEKKSYCTQNNGDCQTCSLVNYGRDCQNHPVKRGDCVRDYIDCFNVETCGNTAGIGAANEQKRCQIVEECLAEMDAPNLGSVLMLGRLEDFQRSYSETADDLLKHGVETAISRVVERQLRHAAEVGEWDVTENYLESMVVGVMLTDDWRELYL